MAERPEEAEDRSELQPEDTLDDVREQVWEKHRLKGLEEVSENEPEEQGTGKGEKEGGENEQEDEAGGTKVVSWSHANTTDRAYESLKTATASFGEQAPAEDGTETTPDLPPEDGVEAKNSSGAGEDYLRDVDEEGNRTDEKPPEIDMLEAKLAPAEDETYSRNDNQVVVTEHKGSENPGS